jgi:signal transduction histidine kinase
MKADIAAGLALTALAVLMTALGSDGVGWIDTLVAPTVTLPVIWRRRAAFASAAVLSAGVVISGLPTFDQIRCGFAIPAALLVLYALGSRSGRRAALTGLALIVASLAFLSVTDPNISPAALSFVVPLCLLVWAAGRAVRSRGVLAAALATRSRELVQQRERTAALAVAVERTRLATQLDVTARDRVREMVALAAAPDDPRDAFARIERLGRESLNEMRGLLGVLRGDDPRAPQPTLAELDALLDAARSGGRAVALAVEGDRRALPGGVEVTAYRIVEHALDGDGPVGVRLRYRADALELEVRGAAGGALAAARERVSAQGGSLEASHSVLRARLPVAYV